MEKGGTTLGKSSQRRPDQVTYLQLAATCISLLLGILPSLCYRPHMAQTLCGVILAAGESSRMGRDKALLPWPPQQNAPASTDTFLSATIKLFFPYVDVVLVVVGKNEAALTPIVYANGAALVVNPDPDRGQFSSLQAGLQEVLNRGSDKAMITLVDRPPVRPETIAILEAAFERAITKRKWAVIPEYQGKHGHPILVGRELISEFMKAPETSSARDVEHAHHSDIEYVAVDDPPVALNIDTPEQYASLTSTPAIPPELLRS